jgi:hypothetical protein
VSGHTQLEKGVTVKVFNDSTADLELTFHPTAFRRDLPPSRRHGNLDACSPSPLPWQDTDCRRESSEMSDRSDEVEEQESSRSGDVTERLAVVARLRPGSGGRARQILAGGAPYELGEGGFERHSVFLAEEAVVFVFEGPGIEGLVRDLVDDPTSSATFSVWGRLLEGTPVLAREEFYWEAG